MWKHKQFFINGYWLTTSIEYSDFAKRGSFLSEVDNAVFLEGKANKRIVHHRSLKFPARSVLPELPDSQPADEYNLAEHINTLSKLGDNVAAFVL